MLDLACFCIRGTTRDSRRGRCPGRTRNDCLARWTQTQVTFERLTSHSRRVNPRRDPFIGRGQRLRTSDGPRANHPMELTESRAAARASVAHLESQAASQELSNAYILCGFPG